MEAVFELYGEAGRPTLRAITERVDEINERQEAGATASRETVRRMFRGQIPTGWGSVRVTLMALCEFAERAFDSQEDDEEFALGNGLYTGRFDIYMKRVWSEALANPEPYKKDPWGTEPPF
ncbi:hypothetical protein [Streptomyces sp. NPDC050988]|uniref:hypothetical protein n=1 Tax=Streptomyces sp. NPDC050988 TaxID=3365637 RepID=UPI0037AB4AA4